MSKTPSNLYLGNRYEAAFVNSKTINGHVCQRTLEIKLQLNYLGQVTVAFCQHTQLCVFGYSISIKLMRLPLLVRNQW